MIKLKDLLKEEYGGGTYEVPENHKAGLRVPKGGSCCATCKYWNKEEEICTNTYYETWAGTNKIPFAANEYCTDWYEPTKESLQSEKGE